MKRLFASLCAALCLTVFGAGAASAGDDPGMTHHGNAPQTFHH